MAQFPYSNPGASEHLKLHFDRAQQIASAETPERSPYLSATLHSRRPATDAGVLATARANRAARRGTAPAPRASAAPRLTAQQTEDEEYYSLFPDERPGAVHDDARDAEYYTMFPDEAR